MDNIKTFKKYNLPLEVKVKVEKNREGFYVEFPDFPGLITQAKHQLDLFYMVTDALLTYFQVPRKVAKDFSVYYLPPLKPDSKNSDTFDKAVLFHALTSEYSSYEHTSVRN